MEKIKDLRFVTEDFHGFTLNLWKESRGYFGRIVGAVYRMPRGAQEGTAAMMTVTPFPGAPKDLRDTNMDRLIGRCKVAMEKKGGKIIDSGEIKAA